MYLRNMQKSTVVIGAIFIVIAIVLGAFGAHALKEILTDEKLASFETGVRYQLFHGLSLLMFGLLDDRISFRMKLVSGLLTAGTCLFSFSIYFLAVSETIGVSMKWLGPITPIGGLLLIIGWVFFIAQVLRDKQKA